MTKTQTNYSSSSSSSDNENVEQDVEESVASAEETNEDIALDVSDTSSSENDDDEDNNDDDDDDKAPAREDRIGHEIKQRYEKTKGMKLYVRFPAKLPADDEELEKQAKALSSLITQVHRPRQKHARFCLVDFASKEDRDTALKAINKVKKTSDDINLKRTIVNIPRTESDEFVENLIKQKLKTVESKKAKRRLKKAGIVSNRADKFTSTLIVTNLPKRTSILEIRTAFPNAVDIQLKNSKAAVTLPSTFDARSAYKKPPTLSGILLKLRFDRNLNNKNNAKKSNDKKQQNDEIKSEKEPEVVAEKQVEINNNKSKSTTTAKTLNKKKKRTAANENAEIHGDDEDKQASTTVAKKRQKQNNSNKKVQKKI